MGEEGRGRERERREEGGEEEEEEEEGGREGKGGGGGNRGGRGGRGGGGRGGGEEEEEEGGGGGEEGEGGRRERRRKEEWKNDRSMEEGAFKDAFNCRQKHAFFLHPHAHCFNGRLLRNLGVEYRPFPPSPAAEMLVFPLWKYTNESANESLFSMPMSISLLQQ